MHTNVKLKSRLLTQERFELISVNAHARWEMWNNELHPTTMLLMPFYFTKPTALPYLQIEHVKQSFRSKWLDDQAEDNEVRGRTEAPAFAGETSEPHTAPSEERQRPKKFEDDIDDDDLCSEEGDAESEDDCLMDVLLREQVRFDNGSASIRPGRNERLVTVEDIANDDTISISLPKVEVEEAVEKPEYGRLIGKMWEKFVAPAPTKQPVTKRAKVSASNPKVAIVTCSNLKPKDLPASSSGQATLNYPPSHGGRYWPDSPQVSSPAGASSPTLSGNGEKRHSSRNKPPVDYKAFLG
ncbi:hypothetical protein R1sor_001127 [Riccia sorocarpa]|uniref:Uncharacterized protein n=1 Tax=Riccia sorocarpa TaxID=122646 RepID=A0ABD3GY79_9MARC